MIRINYGIGIDTKDINSAFANKLQKSLDKFLVKYFKKTRVENFNTVFAIAIPGVGFPLRQIRSGKTPKKAPLSTRRKKQLKARINRNVPNQLKKVTKKVAQKRNPSYSNHLKQKRDKFGRFIPKKVTKKCRQSH